MEEVWGLTIGIAAAFGFPLLAVVIYRRRERRHNRQMGMRRTDKIQL